MIQIQTYYEWWDCKAFCHTVQIMWSTELGTARLSFTQHH